ncbi:MAG: hypothetical protein QM802_15380 [Agriterribacter sp.]
MRLKTENFEIISNGNIYQVRATEYINGSGEVRYRVSYNDSPVCVFGWNEALNGFAMMHDHRNPGINHETEKAISHKLENIQAMKEAA